MSGGVGFSESPVFDGMLVAVATTLVSFLMLAPVAAARNVAVLPICLGATVAVGYVVMSSCTG